MINNAMTASVPGAGHDGGRVVFEGPPADLVEASGSLTGRHLKS